MNRLSDSAAIDVHQHLWPPSLLEALRARHRPPRLHGWTLELEGEPVYPIDSRHHDVDVRGEQVIADGLDLALISLSSPLGIELLPAAEGAELLDAYHEGTAALGRPFGAWAAASLADPDPDALASRLAEGFVGLQLPANALSHELDYARAAPLLEALETAGRPLLIHPGPASVPRDVPPWWPAIVSYVQQMHEAWYAFGAFGRRRHPRLRVCFAMLAGLAPLHGERFHTRAGRRTVVDENVYLDISSYGTRAIDATVRVLGIDALVEGSDRPYAEPVLADLGAAAQAAIRGANPVRLLDHKEVSNDLAVASGAQS